MGPKCTDLYNLEFQNPAVQSEIKYRSASPPSRQHEGTYLDRGQGHRRSPCLLFYEGFLRGGTGELPTPGMTEHGHAIFTTTPPPSALTISHFSEKNSTTKWKLEPFTPSPTHLHPAGSYTLRQAHLRIRSTGPAPRTAAQTFHRSQVY